MAQPTQLLLIGAGALGMRHLQSMLELADTAIWVVEPDLAAQQRCVQHLVALSFSHMSTKNMPAAGMSTQEQLAKKVQWMTTLPELAMSFDVVVVATNAGPRFSVVQALLERFKVRYLILEKVLFQRLEHYAAMADLLQRTATISYVNCPRRLYPLYQKIQQQLDPAVPLQITISGQNWGLACNSVHFIDLLGWLAQSPPSSIDWTGLQPTIFPSKRAGYQEVAGELLVNCENGSWLKLCCDIAPAAPATLQIELQQAAQQWHLDENSGLVTRSGTLTDVLQLPRAPFQSELTAQVIENLLQQGHCALPTFAQASISHQLLINNLLAFFSIQQGRNVDICPIT